MLFTSVNVNAQASKDLIINKNKTNITVSQEFNGDYYLPLRDVVINLGGISFYDSSTSSIVFKLEGKSFVYNIKTKQLDYNVGGVGNSYTNNFDIRLNNGKSFVSLDFLQTFLNVSYEKTKESLLISSKEELSNNFTIKPILITHGGGEINNIPITNSLEAIEKSIRNGSRLIELDFLKTSDNKFILGHDWGRANRLLNGTQTLIGHGGYVTETITPLTPVNMDDLINILEKNPDLSIVTDTKEDNKDFLLHIHNNYRPSMKQLKPQVYNIDEYHYAKSLGFKDIIFTLYKVYLTDDEVVSFVKNNDVYAVTMAESRAKTGLTRKLSNMGIMTYVHTVNDLNLINKYKSLGASGFYTDRLY